MTTIHLSHTRSAKAEAACLVFCSAFLDFSPGSELLYRELTPLSFEVEFSSHHPIDQKVLVLLEERCRFILKEHALETFEMIPPVAKQFLSHHKQKPFSKLIDQDASTVNLARLGSFVGIFEGDENLIKELTDFKVVRHEVKKTEISPKKTLYTITFTVVFSTEVFSLKDGIRAFKEAEKKFYLKRAEQLKLIDYQSDTDHLVILPQGVQVIDKIKKAFFEALEKEGFQRVITFAEDSNEMITYHRDLHKRCSFKKSFEESFSLSEDSFDFQILSFFSVGKQELKSEIIYSLNFLEEMIKILGLPSRWVIPGRLSKDKELRELLQTLLEKRDLDKEVTIETRSNETVVALRCEDCFQSPFSLMSLEIRKQSENGFMLICSLGSFKPLLVGTIEEDVALSNWLGEGSCAISEACK